MSDNQRYYYIKLKENYFDQDNIKILEAMPNGNTYSLIILKLYLKSAKSDGKLMMTPTIPYSPDKVEILANVIGHDVDHVKEAIKAGLDLDLITIIGGHEIWMTDIQAFIGQSSTEADRKREYRKRISQNGQMSGQMDDKSPPEIEIELELELEKETEEHKQAFQLACLLERLHKEVDLKYKGSPQKWAADIEKLLRLDSREASEVERVIRWCKTPGNFWFSNIMSGKKLREKYPQLLIQMEPNEISRNCEDRVRVDEAPLEFGSLL